MTLSLKEPLGVKRGVPKSLLAAIMLLLFTAGVVIGYAWAMKSAKCQTKYCIQWDSKTHNFVRVTK
jgi:hypothetical protein